MLVSYKGSSALVVGEFEKQVGELQQLFFILRLPGGKLREVPACRCPIVVTVSEVEDVPPFKYRRIA